MFSYLMKRSLLMIPTILGITFITFLMMKLAPGDPMMLKLMFSGKNISAEALAAHLQSQIPALELPEEYKKFVKTTASIFGDETSPWHQKTEKALNWTGENSLFYAKWLKNITQLNFGLSFKDRRPVLDKIIEVLPVTLTINISTILVVYFISIPLGIWSALRQGSVIDKVVMVKLFVLYSLPGFWVATILLIYFAGADHWDIFPLTGIISDNFHDLNLWGKANDLLWHLVLPVTADTIGSFAFLSRFTRSNFLDVIKQDYIRTARAKGLDERTVLFKHGLKNAMIPFVTLMGTLLPALLGGSVVIEQIFSIPGMGMLSMEAVLGRDHNVIMGIATVSACLTLVSLLLADLAYGLIDPRIRYE